MKNDIIELDDVKNKIYEIRGKQVMLDSDLANIYGYTTKNLNRQVKNNIEKFDNDFMFQLSDNEINYLSRCKNCTSMQTIGKKGGRVYNPYVFTEQGIYMLMTVLKGELATRQSKALIRIFKIMKDYILLNSNEQKLVNNQVFKNAQDIKLLQATIDKFNLKEIPNNMIFYEGQTYDAYSLLIDILSESKKEIILVDNYSSKELLDTLKNIDKKITVISSNIDEKLKKKYESQYKNIKFINNKTFHDRFIVIDKSIVYTCGASFKDLGKKCFAINKITSLETKEYFINKISDIK